MNNPINSSVNFFRNNFFHKAFDGFSVDPVICQHLG